jgi:hypothetical protein
MKHKVLSLRRSTSVLAPLKSVSVLRILGIYAMDELRRTEWDKVGRYIAQKGGAYIEKYAYEVSLSAFYEITQSRCRVRKSCGGFYFDPTVFNTRVTPSEEVPTDPEIAGKDEAEGVDEVLFCYCFCRTANPSPRSIDCWCSYPAIFHGKW